MNVPTARFTRRNILQPLPPALVAPALPALAQSGLPHGMPAEPLDPLEGFATNNQRRVLLS
jgi:hypothetical protein